VLPHQWRGVGEQFIWHRPAKSSHAVEGVGHIGRVPIYDCCYRQVEARCAKLLSVLTPVRDPALFEGADDLCQRVALLAFVQARRRVASVRPSSWRRAMPLNPPIRAVRSPSEVLLAERLLDLSWLDRQ
jgi:hypothetical protein